MIEDDFHVPVAAGRARRGDGLPILPELEAWADQGLEPYLRRYAERQLEALYALAPVFLDPVGVGAGKVHLLVPVGREIQATPRGRHPDEGDLPAGPREAHRVLHRPRGSHALEDLVRPAHDDRLAELRLVYFRPEPRGQLFVDLLGMNDLVGAEPEGFFSLAFVLGDADHTPGAGELPERRDDEEADAPGADDEHRLLRTRVRLERRVHRAGEGLYD